MERKKGFLGKFVLSLVAFVLLFSSIPLSNVFAHGGSHNEETQKEEKKEKNKTAKPKKVSTEESLLENVEKVEEVKNRRTINGKTYKNSDLSYTTDVHTGAVHYKDSEGMLQPIENEVKEIKGSKGQEFKLKSEKNKFSVDFAEKVKKNKELVSITLGKERVGFILQNAQKEAGVLLEENKVEYHNVFKDTDIKYTLLPEGLKEDIILNTKEGQTEYIFSITGSLTAIQRGRNIEFYNKENKLVWLMTPPYMEDAKGVFSHAIGYSLIENGNKQSIHLKVNKEYVQDPERAFPIIIDPTVNLGGSSSNTLDTYVMQDYPSYNYYNSVDLRTGYADSTGITRSYMNFSNSLPALNGGLLVKAELKAYKFSNGYNTINTNLYAQRVSSAWSVNSVTWNSQPSIDTTKSYGSTPVNGGDGWATLNVTDLVNKWYDGTAKNGLVLRSTSEGTLGTYRKFNSADASSSRPYLAVTYTGVPTAPSGTYAGNGSGSGTGHVDLTWTPVTGATGYKVLIYNGKSYEEFNVGNVTNWSTKGKKLWPTATQIQQGSYALRLDGSGTELADDPSPVYKNSGGTYPTNKNYWFRIKAYNAYGETSQSGAYMPTLPDQTKPSKPGVPTASNKLNSNFTFTWGKSSDSNSGLKGYNVYVGTSPGAKDVASAFVTTNSYTIPNAVARAKYYMYVTAVDNQGNISTNSDNGSDVARKQLDATISNYSFPAQMEASGNYNVIITVKNEGLQTWTSSDGIYLGSKEETDPLTKDTRLPLSSSDSIGTTQEKTFNLTFVGNKNPGDYISEWQMLKLNVGRFGDSITKNIKVVDTTPPTGNIVINNGEALTNSPNVNLQLSLDDNANGPYYQKFKNESNSWSTYENYSSSKQWTLSNSNGEKTVSVNYKDASGNESIAYSDKITLDTSFPTAKIDSPNSLDYVNGKKVINGSATDNDLKDYTLSYGVGETPSNWTVVSTKNSVISQGELGVWDTTGLQAGLYTLKLTVTDQAGNTSVASKIVWVDPLVSMLGEEDYWAYEDIQSGYGSSKVNLANGNLYALFTDSSLNGRGLDTSILRVYNSQDDSDVSLGKGWRFNHDMSISEQVNGDILLTDEDGTRHLFSKNSDATYTSPLGVFRNLTKLSDGKYTLEDLDESSLKYSFNSNGQLISYEDRNGNKIQIRYDADGVKEIEDSTGRIISFTYQGNKLSDLTTFAGTRIHYSYTNDLLSKVEYFDQDTKLYRSMSYSYNADGKLKEYTNPNQNKVIYDYNGHRIVNVKSSLTSYNAATGAKNEAFSLDESFNYDLIKKSTRVTETGPTKSNISDYEINEYGNLVKSIDDPSGIKIEERNIYENNKLKESFDGKGYKTSYTYDGRGNVLTKTEPQTTDIDGNVYTPVTQFEYKSGTSLISKEIDPLNRITTYDYDTKGNRKWTMDVDGFKESYTYDSYGNVLETKYERGPIYGFIPNYSFESGEGSSVPNWTVNGATSYQSTDKRSGSRSLSVSGNVESELIPVKKGNLPIRALVWMKGTGATVSVQFLNQDKGLISTQTSAPSSSTAWSLQHVVSDIPTGASFVKVKVNAGTSPVLMDDVRIEETNYISTNKYSDNGLNLIESYDPYGKKATFEYDVFGNKKKEINELGQIAQFNYNADGQLLEETDRRGKMTKYEYDPIGNLIKETDALAQVVEYEYDEQNHQVLIRNPKVTRTFYDSQIPRESEVISITEIDEYNALGEKVAEKDGNGSIFRYEYDALGRQTKSIDPLRNELRFTYDSNDNKVTEENFAWDEVTSTLYPKGKTYYRYDELNRMTGYSDPTKDQNTLVEQTKYDSVGNVIKTIDGAGNWTEFQYDKNNNAIYSKDSSTPPVETWTLYDGLGNEAIAHDKLGATTYIYEANGQLKEVVDAEGKKTTYTYNAAGDKTKLVDATGSVTDWTYDEEGQLKTETNEVADPTTGETTLQVTSYEYDSIGQVKKKSIAETKGTNSTTSKENTYVYDELGRLVKEAGVNLEDGKKTESRYYHDRNGNVTNTWIYDETNPVPLPVDPDGDGYFNSETISVYDKNNRLLSESISHTGTTTTNTFNDKNNEETLKNALGDTVITYDDNDRTKKIVTPNFDTFNYEYLVDGSLSKILSPGVETSISYNGGSKVKSLKATNRNNQTTISDLQYTHSDTEQIVQIADKGTVKKKYTYTASGQLETVESNGKKLKYFYDANSNIVKVQNLTTGKVVEEYSYLAENRIRQKKVYNETTGSLIRTYDYEHNATGTLSKITIKEGANVTVTNYDYNSDDQLMKVNKTVNGQKQPEILYEYDTDGNRIAKNVNDGTKNTHYHYHLDTNGGLFLETIEGPSQQQRVKYYRDADGNLLSFSLDEVVYYYQFNARGDVIAITDAAGNVKATYDYDEWGNVTSITGDQNLAKANVYRYVGKYGVLYDADTNLYLMGWRDYDPTTGRFIVPDEYEGTEEDPTSLNRYLYADADPVNNIDPDGHAPKWLQKGWKATKKYSKKGYNYYIGNDIKTLRSKKSKWYHKAGATASIASNFIPGAGQAKWAVKAAKTGIKYGKKAKKAKKFTASSLKKSRSNRNVSVSKKSPAKIKKGQLRVNLQYFSSSKKNGKSSLPLHGPKNGSKTIYNKNGTAKQKRYYDNKGRAKKDMDYDDHGQPKYHPWGPHRHKWKWEKNKPKRGKGEPMWKGRR
ncbi:DNRLRE domain-containing protein [Rossellomorea arthrocnemi]|uniref:DNRLRE domain-containing protein n=1 Tax=Rossellomorea arthrocnemi TaxID=2769542 RepID=UPI0019186F4E|nr:DNRLRE domain-containing protein [Rossellomorea arthrocnemi]